MKSKNQKTSQLRGEKRYFIFEGRGKLFFCPEIFEKIYNLKSNTPKWKSRPNNRWIPVQGFPAGRYLSVLGLVVAVPDGRLLLVLEPQDHVRSVFGGAARVFGPVCRARGRHDFSQLHRQTVVVAAPYVARQPGHRAPDSGHRDRAHCNKNERKRCN